MSQFSLATASACLVPLLLLGSTVVAQNRSIAIGDAIDGEITSASHVNYNNGSRSVTYPFDAEVGHFIRFEVVGPLCSDISIFRNNRRLAATDGGGYCDDGDHSTSLSFQADAPGRHLVAVSGQNSNAYGPFTLKSRAVEPYAGGPLVPGSDITDILGSSPRTYSLQIVEAGLYQIDQRSSEFDSVLNLTGNGISRNDDDGGGNLDARISAYLQPGTYQVSAESYNGGTGLFSLTVGESALPAGTELRTGGALVPGEQVFGLLSSEPVAFSLDISENGLLTIDLGSDDFDAFLELAGDGVAFSDDDSGGNLDARISTVVTPGRYTVTASSYGSEVEGVFTLKAELQEVPEGTGGGPLRLGTTHSNELLPGATDRYTFTIQRAGRYLIDMTSEELDSYIRLVRDGIELASDDDSGGDLNAQLGVELSPGEYELLASSYGGTAGEYQIRVQAE